MRFPTRGRPLVVLAACVVLGAAGGIAGSAASSRHKSTSATKAARPAFRADRPGGPGPGPRPVHADAIVLNKAGTAFITATEDNGTVKSVSGSEVTITEAANGVTYKDTTLTIPDGATIVRDGATATLSDLKAGDHVMVHSSSDGTSVFAADSSWHPAGPRGPHGGPPMPPPPGS